ncbi:MAG: formylglycine-generating enzyme family protein [Kofleriaceae bacterium]|nr:MAG: formylglycine-generating enzyme family protein [Kofleriaceae bacterium]MBZ0235124.1 formylglycine-generating enzyme family protein [Kofleriaceae bacterium]
MVVGLRHAIVLAALVAACRYEPSLDPCRVSCASGGCPAGMSCRGDGFCHEGAADEPFTACPMDVDASDLDAPSLDGSEPPPMIFIPAGPFVMGSDDSEGDADELPERIVTLSAYSIDQHEVTNAQWRACVSAGVCSPPSSINSRTRVGYYASPEFDDYPVVYVSWTQARVYCVWAGKRLPTEAEWEKAARGGCELVEPATCGAEDERTFPWGEAPATCDRANFDPAPECVGDTDRVGARSPLGDSPYGVQDLAGNVWEWVQDWHDLYPPGDVTDPTGPFTATERVQRGGGWSIDASALRVANRSKVEVTNQVWIRGLRCARSP